MQSFHLANLTKHHGWHFKSHKIWELLNSNFLILAIAAVYCELVIERRSRGTTHPESVSPRREVPSLILRGAFYPQSISSASINLQDWVTRDLMFCNERLIFQELYLGGKGVSIAELCQWKCHNGDITSRLLRLPPTDVPEVETKE